MAAPFTVDEFLDLILKSGVMEEKRLSAYIQKARTAATLPTDPAKVAGLLVRDGLLTTFQAEQIMQGKWRRFTIGKYKVLERIGSGGMGSVFLCEHKLMRRRVAVKVLPTAKAEDPASLDRFYREARAVAALDHPNIVHAYDIDQEDKLHFLVMEYVDGASLQELVKRAGPLSVVRACHYIRQAALGLEHAHEAGLVHRDIKPGNILVDRQGTVKLLDMGLARFFNDEEDILTKKYDESVLGTADYLAPEQAIDSHSVDIRADIYGMGATFYFLLAGRPPFGEGTIAQKLLWHQTRNPKPLSEYRKDVPPELMTVIARMMAKEPAQRYSVPGEVAEALAPFTLEEIGPPPEVEMPRLSLAASGHAPASDMPETSVVRGGSSSGSGSTPTRGNSGTATAAPAVAPRALQAMSTATARPPSGSIAPPPATRAAPVPPAPSPPPVLPRPPSPRSTPPPPLPPRPAELETPAPWQSEANDTVPPLPGEFATPPLANDAAPASLIVAGPTRATRRLRLVLAAVGIPFLFSLGVLLYLYFPHAPSPPVPGIRPALTVTAKETGRPYTFRTIKQALQQAQAGDIIELHDEVHEENLVVEVGPGQTRADVTIQAAPGRNVVWSPRGKGSEPLLKLQRAAGYQIKGPGLTLDGKDQSRDLIAISLLSSRLTVDGLILKGYTRSGVALLNASGDVARPIRLLNLDAPTATAKKPAIFLDAIPSIVTVPYNDYIEIQDLHVQGIAPAQAVVKKDSSVVGKNVVLP